MKVFYIPPDAEGETVASIPIVPLSSPPTPEQIEKPTESELVLVDSINAWHQALQEVRNSGICGLDLETIGGIDPLVARVRLAQLAITEKVFVADVFVLGSQILNDLAILLEDGTVRKVAHNAKFELSMIQASQNRRLRTQNIFCTMLASQVVWSGYYHLVPAPKAKKFPGKQEFPEQSLKALAKRHLGIDLAKEFQESDWGGELSADQIDYAAQDARVLLPLHDILIELLEKNELEHVADMEFQALPAVVELELSGLPLDVETTKTMLESKATEVSALAKELQDEASQAGFKPRPKKSQKNQVLLNSNSHLDVLDFLRSQGHNVDSSKEEVLKTLNNPWADKLLKHKKLNRQAKFLKNWLCMLHPKDDRLHAKYYQIQAATGRFSSRDPNAQQIPKRGEDGKAIRKLFKAPSGKKLIKGDFAGIELRIMACLSGDKTMLDAFQNKQDLHRLTASKITGTPYDQITKDQRQGAKAVNFLLIYGGQPELLKQRAKDTYGVDMSLEDAKQAHKKFFETYSGIANWHREQREEIQWAYDHFFHDKERGFYDQYCIRTVTADGRKRIWSKFKGRTLARVNQLYNTPSHGTGADMLKLVLAELYRSLPEEVKLVVCVHDEIILEAPGAIAQSMAILLKETMERVGSELLEPVPVEVEVEILSSWGGD